MLNIFFYNFAYISSFLYICMFNYNNFTSYVFTNDSSYLVSLLKERHFTEKSCFVLFYISYSRCYNFVTKCIIRYTSQTVAIISRLAPSCYKIKTIIISVTNYVIAYAKAHSPNGVMYYCWGHRYHK